MLSSPLIRITIIASKAGVSSLISGNCFKYIYGYVHHSSLVIGLNYLDEYITFFASWLLDLDAMASRTLRGFVDRKTQFLFIARLAEPWINRITKIFF